MVTHFSNCQILGRRLETSIQLSIASTKQLQRHLLCLNPGLFKENIENLNIHVRFDWQQQYLRHRILRRFPLQHPLVFTVHAFLKTLGQDPGTDSIEPLVQGSMV